MVGGGELRYEVGCLAMPPSTRVLNERRVLKDRRLFQVAQVFQAGSTVGLDSQIQTVCLSSEVNGVSRLELELGPVKAPYSSLWWTS